jgi:AcrR family transcriptional regulator
MTRLAKLVKERNRSLVAPVFNSEKPEISRFGNHCPTRRRGDQLLAAIFEATICLLAKVGYSDLSLEAVAHLAQTGKASIYRRWSSKVDLVIDALAFEINKCEIALDLSDLRTGLISKMSSMCEAFSGDLGRAMAGCISEFQREPKLQTAAEEQIINPRKQQMMASLEVAAAAGQIRNGDISNMVPDLPIAFVMHSITFEGRAPNQNEIEDFVDNVMLPLLR